MPVIARAPRAAALSNISTTETIFKKNSDSTAACVVYLPGSSRFNGKSFKVRASGRVTTATTTNVTVQLQVGTSTTVGSNVDIEASTARAVNTASANWFIEAQCNVDSTAQKLGGYGRSMVNNLFDAEAALDNAGSSLRPDLDDSGTSPLGFVVTITFSGADAANTAYLDDFVIEAD